MVRSLFNSFRKAFTKTPVSTTERAVPKRSDEEMAHTNLIRRGPAYLHTRKQFREAKRIFEVGCGTGYGSAWRSSPGLIIPKSLDAFLNLLATAAGPR